MSAIRRMIDQPTMQRCHCNVPCTYGREAKRVDCRVRQARLAISKKSSVTPPNRRRKA